MGKAPPAIRRGKPHEDRSCNAVPLDVQAACQSWATHHAKCETCSREDWYNPDKEALCDKGQGLFADWDNAVARSIRGGG